MSLAWWPFSFSWCTPSIWPMTLQAAFNWFKAFLAVCVEIFFSPFLIYKTPPFVSWKRSLCLKHIILTGRLCKIQTPQSEKGLLPVSSLLTKAIASKEHQDFSRNTTIRETWILKLTSTVLGGHLVKLVSFTEKENKTTPKTAPDNNKGTLSTATG